MFVTEGYYGSTTKPKVLKKFNGPLSTSFLTEIFTSHIFPIPQNVTEGSKNT